MPTVLMLNLTAQKINQIQILSVRMNFACRIIRPEEQSCLISDLLSGSTAKTTTGKIFSDEMLIMDGFSHKDLNELLNEMIRKNNTVSLKAVTTATNTGWTVSFLHDRLAEENWMMHNCHPEEKA